MIKFIDTQEFHALAKRGGDLREIGLRRDAIGANPTTAAQTGPIPWIFSSNKIDRMGDRILAWDLKNFSRNPVCLWSYQIDKSPIGKVLGIKFLGGVLTGAVQFAPRDVSAFADQIRRMVAAGFIKSSSVGFRPTKVTPSNDPARRGGYDFEAELLEISVVNIPANADALVSSSMASPKSSVAERVADAGRRRREVEAEELATLLRPARMARAAALRREIEGDG